MKKLVVFLIFGLLVQVVCANGFNLPEGVEYSKTVLHDPWDMQNQNDIYPLSWANNLAGWQIKNGILEATSKDNDPNIWLLYPGVVSSLKLGKVGENYPIDSSKFSKLAFLMWLPEDLSPNDPGGVIYWHKGANSLEEFSTNLGYSDFFPTYPGWHLYVIDLKEIPAYQNPWDGIIKGLRIDPCNTCSGFKIKWVRLIDPTLPTYLHLPDNPDAVIVDNDTIQENGFVTTLRSEDQGIDCSILPPGTYYLAKINDLDYATTSLSNTWDLKEQQDVSLVNGFTNINFSENGFSGVTASNDPYLILNVSTIHPIDAQKYHYLLIDMEVNSIPSDEAGMVIYWGHSKYDYSQYSEFIPLRSGRSVYRIDLAQYPSWANQIYSLRIDPCNHPNIAIKIYSVLLTTENNVNLADLRTEYYAEPLKIIPKPLATITSPSFHTGEDYATTVLRNPWEFDDMGDVKRTAHLSSYQLCSQIEDLNLTGSFLYGESTPAPEGEWGDPGVYVLLQQNQSPLNADKYHYLTLKMYLPGELDLTNGAMARIAWKRDDFDSGLTTDDIILYPGLEEYKIDLKKVHWEPASTRTWSGNVRYLRIDPHEFPNPRGFYLDSLYVRANSESKGIFPISFHVQGEGEILASIYYDNDQQGGDGTLIASNLSLSPNQSYTYFWDTHNVLPGTYYIYLKLRNPLDPHPVIIYSETPVVVLPNTLTQPVSMNYRVINNDVTLSWTLPAGLSNISTYVLYYSLFPDWMPYRFEMGNINSITFPNIPAGTYYVTITAKTQSGEETPLAIQELVVE